jgi:hypothetical protein
MVGLTLQYSAAVNSLPPYPWNGHLQGCGSYERTIRIATTSFLSRASRNLAALRRDGDGLTAKQTVVLRYTDTMTNDIEVSKDPWLGVREFFSDMKW